MFGSGNGIPEVFQKKPRHWGGVKFVRRLSGGPTVRTGGIQKRSGVAGHFCTDLLAQEINWNGLAIPFELPIRPSIATWGALKVGTDLMDRPFDIVSDKRAICTHFGSLTARVCECFARAKKSTLDQNPKSDPRFGAFGLGNFQRFLVKLSDLGDAFFSDGAVAGLALNPDEIAT